MRLNKHLHETNIIKVCSVFLFKLMSFSFFLILIISFAVLVVGRFIVVYVAGSDHIIFCYKVNETM